MDGLIIIWRMFQNGLLGFFLSLPVGGLLYLMFNIKFNLTSTAMILLGCLIGYKIGTDEYDKLKNEERRKNQVKLEIERQQQKAERDRQEKLIFEKEEVKKMNCYINCPECKGTGKVIVDEQYDPDTDKRNNRVWRRFGHVLDKDKAIELIKRAKSGVDDDFVYETKDGYITRMIGGVHVCGYCQGQGIAKAYFEEKLEECSKCLGRKVVTVKNAEDVGFSIDEITCDVCNGNGQMVNKYVHVQMLNPWGDMLIDEPYFPEFYVFNMDHYKDEGSKKFFSMSRSM